MKSLVVTAPGSAEIQEVPDPVAAPGDVVVQVGRVGICGTDLEMFTGEMAYVRDGSATFPLRLGHEWMGTVCAVGAGVDSAWIGTRVTGDTMLGCGQCRRCQTGRQHVCADRDELGLRDGRPGALAEKLSVPAKSLFALPDSVDDVAGAMVEPGGNAYRAAAGAQVGPGDRCLIIGTGAIGVLTAMMVRAQGADVQLLGKGDQGLDFVRGLGFSAAADRSELPDLPWDAVVDASNGVEVPALASELVDAGGRLVWIGLAPAPTMVDSRAIALADVTAVGILSASPALGATVDTYASGAVDPRPLVGTQIGLADLPALLPELVQGRNPLRTAPGPKVIVAINP